MMNNFVTDKESFMWASGHYLTQHLPNDYDEWEEEELDKFILDNVWEPFEYYSANDVWENISNLAHDFKTTLNDRLVPYVVNNNQGKVKEVLNKLD